MYGYDPGHFIPKSVFVLVSFGRSFVCSFVRSFVHSFVRSFVRSFIRSFVRAFVRPSVRSFVRSLVRVWFLTRPGDTPSSFRFSGSDSWS